MPWRAQTFCWNEGALTIILCQHLYEILPTSLNVKNSENVVESGCFKKCLRWRVPFFCFFEMMKICKLSLLMFWHVTKRLVFI